MAYLNVPSAAFFHTLLTFITWPKWNVRSSCSWRQVGGHVRSDWSSLTLNRMQWFLGCLPSLWTCALLLSLSYFRVFTFVAQRNQEISEWRLQKMPDLLLGYGELFTCPCVSEALNNWWETAHVHRLHLWPELIRIIAIHEISCFLLLRGRRRFKTWGREKEAHMDQFYISSTTQDTEVF